MAGKGETVTRVLCYGDSNTWGFDPASQTRFPRSVRWTGRLASELGARFEIIEEGLNGRTSVWYDPVMNRMSGAAYLEPCLKSHQPLDVVVLLLGTNDLKSRYGAAPAEIARGVGRLVEIVYKCDTRHGGRTPDVILCAPPPIEEVGVFAEEFAGAAMRSRRLAEYLIQIAREYDCPFLDAGAVARSSAIDGIHWERDSHAKFAKAVASAVGEMKDKGIRGHP